MSTSFEDFPCGSHCQAECKIQDKMIRLQQSLLPPPQDKAADLVDAFLESYRKLCLSSPEVKDVLTPDVALPALFDFLMSVKYIKRQVSNGGWTYCSGENVAETPALYFPFVKACPRCSVKKGIVRPLVEANKPKSDPIGEIASDCTVLILSRVISKIAPGVKIGKSTLRQGDVDLVIYDQNVVVLAEIKSSPLVVYPLEIKRTGIMTEVRDGVSAPKLDHSPATADLDTSELLMYIPHLDFRISLGNYSDTDWPYSNLIDFVSNPQNVAILISAWKELYEVYLGPQEGKRRSKKDHRIWLTCGCGGSVDDSKNAPGIERTDDIKKGTYQVLKYGTYYKEKCLRHLLRAALVSNLFVARGFNQYLAEMHDVVWTKEKYSVALKNNVAGVVAFQADRVFNLYDAILCLNRSIYRDEHLREISSLDNFAAKFCS
ncbi:MAG: hypothetical protein Fur0044_17770 [Anaerolineae bacterium]